MERLKRPDSIREDQSSDEEHDVATTSPYTTRAVTVRIGESQTPYTLLQDHVNQYPGLKERLNSDDSIILDTVDENIGHTLIHYIYTSRYQTLGLSAIPTELRAATEFKRSVLAYCAARLCGIAKLEDHTKGKTEVLSRELPLFDLQRVAEEVSSKLPQHDDWFSTSIQRWIKARLVADDTLLADDRLPDVIGRNTVFDKAVVKSLMEMCIERAAEVEPPHFDGDRTPLAIGSPKTESIADSGIHMEDLRQDFAAVSMADSVPKNGVAKTAVSNTETPQPHHLKETLPTETTHKPIAKDLPAEHSDSPAEELVGQNMETIEGSPRKQSLPVATDSDRDSAKPNPDKKKKKKKNKKKKTGEVVVTPQTVDES